MKIDEAGYNFIKKHEGLKLQAYQDSVGVYTIGYGTIKYSDGTPVKKGDVITVDQALILLEGEVNPKSATVDGATNRTTLTQNQFNALVDFTYNVGTAGFLSSSLLKQVRINPNAPEVKDDFLKWDKGHKDGQIIVIPGLLARREDEVALYFS